MFRHLSLGNFKRFQACDLELKAINVFVGPNNSGKSSLISALRLVIQTLDSYDDQVPLLLNGPLGDFGTFKDVVYQNHRGRPMEIGFTIDMPDLRKIPVDLGTRQEVTITAVFKYLTAEREVYAESITIRTDDEHIITLRYSKETRRHNVEKIGRTVVPSSLKPVLSREFRIRHFVPAPIGPRLGGMETLSRESPYRAFLEHLNASSDADIPRMLSRLSARLTRVIASADYLGPLRTPPARTYLFSGERTKRIGVSGENMPSILATSAGRRSRVGHATVSLPSRINKWLQKAEMAKAANLTPISDRHFELRVANFFTGENQNIADVGYGHSQVLPFLAGGYALPPGSLYMAEQPELHLHPRAQAGLADYLVELLEAGTQTLIETHSEHVILRLQQHVAARRVNPQSVRVFYVHNNPSEARLVSNQCAEVCVIDLDDKGQFKTPWPDGFFPEKLKEAKELALARLQHLDF